ncbi:MAG: TIGR02757 family protein [Elusimicrobia bacterium]|nr:TIGR02757 family protein [Elusimicrobiota bacterium]
MLSLNFLEKNYKRYNMPEFLHPDPLEFVLKYSKQSDMETAGLIASSLAYGNVKQILKSVEAVLSVMGRSPAQFLLRTGDGDIKNAFCGFRHRFTAGNELCLFLINLKNVFKRHGSVEKLFLKTYCHADATIEETIYRFARAINPKNAAATLVPDPDKKSSFKRLNLFLRWMVRKDSVDPGVWTGIPPSKLIVPLDTHMHKTAVQLGLTSRKDAGMRTALEITAGFAAINPRDPVKYDFALTRIGILKIKNGGIYVP